MDTMMLLVLFTMHLVYNTQAAFKHTLTDYGEISSKLIPFSPRNVGGETLVFAYLGIPYAKPPIEGKRFYHPEPIEPWGNITLDGTTTPPSCPQIGDLGYESSEDCLYLNIYVPESVRSLPNYTSNASVMVYIHGGGFAAGSSTGYPVNPVPLAALGDVIVVTLNYRLNIFGFFTTGDDPDGIPPNLGLLDQRLALQWVYENIDAFGGDPEKITLFGWSAGAASVGLHMLLEDSRRYFKRVILQSSVPLNPWTQLLSPERVRELTAVAGEIGGCGNQVGRCLRTKSVEELLRIYEKIEETNVRLDFVPSFDGEFFPNDIPSLIQRGSFRDIDVLLGTTEDEGKLVTLTVAGALLERPVITSDTFSLLLRTVTSDNPLLTGLIAAIYAGDIDETNNYEEAYSALNGDIEFTCGVAGFARQVADAGSEVYMYRMTQEPAISIYDREWLGAIHGEDLQFVFGLPLLEEGPTSNDRYQDVKLSFYMIQMWANFAKSGNPNKPRAFPSGIQEWPRFLPDTQIYKELNTGFSNGQKLRQHYCNFWDSLLPHILNLTEAAAGGAPN